MAIYQRGGTITTNDKRALYYDTDSVFYVTDLKKGDNELPIGSMLGELTDELADKGPGTFIEAFVSGGPKFYAYKFRKLNGECGYVCKVKGIRLDFANSQKINFESTRQTILGEKRPIELRRAAIRRTAFHDVLTQMETKSCKPVFGKKRYAGLNVSYPYGYQGTIANAKD